MRGDGVHFLLGFMQHCPVFPFGTEGSFGAPGTGGSLGFANRIGTSVTDDPRVIAMRKSCIRSFPVTLPANEKALPPAADAGCQVDHLLAPPGVPVLDLSRLSSEFTWLQRTETAQEDLKGDQQVRGKANATTFERMIEMPRNTFWGLYSLALIATVISADLLFFRNRFWERLMVNIAILLVFASILRFLRNPGLIALSAVVCLTQTLSKTAYLPTTLQDKTHLICNVISLWKGIYDLV